MPSRPSRRSRANTVALLASSMCSTNWMPSCERCGGSVGALALGRVVQHQAFATHADRQRLTALERRTDHPAPRIDADTDDAPAPLQPECERLPRLRQHWIERELLAEGFEPDEAHHHRHPQATQRGDVNAAGAVHRRRIEIDVRGLLQVALSKIETAEPGRHERMQRRAEAAAVAAARLVI